MAISTFILGNVADIKDYEQIFKFWCSLVYTIDKPNTKLNNHYNVNDIKNIFSPGEDEV